MRIGFVTTEFPPAFGSGLATYTHVAARAWAAAGHDVHVLTPSTAAIPVEGITTHAFMLPPAPDAPLQQGLRGYGEDFERAYAMTARLEAFVREADIDVLECQDTLGLAYFFLQQRTWRPTINQVPVVVRLQESTTLRLMGDGVPRHTLDRYVTGLLEDGASRMADAWLAPSARLLRLARRRLGARQPRGIHAAFPVEAFPSAAGSRDRELLFVGHFRRGHGAELLVDALRQVLPANPDWRVRIIGSDWIDPLRARSMREWMFSRLDAWHDRLSFDHLRSPSQTREALGRAAIVVAPSPVPGTSYAALEALAAGSLVIASDTSAAGDLIQDGVPGMTCPAGDATALAQALTSAMHLTSDARDAIGQGAQAAMRDLAAPERFVARLCPAYASLRTRPRTVAIPSPAPRVARPRVASRAPASFALIVPCFNMGETLSETLASVLTSTRVPDEVIVVDDGSTDPRTHEVLDQWRSRVQVLSIENRGLAGARNAGAAAATADAFAFLDADDLISPEFFDYAMTALHRQPNAGFVTPWVQLFGAGDAVFCPPAPHFPLQLVRNLSVCFGLIRREAFDDAGGYKPSMRFGYEDWEFWIGVLEAGWAGLSIPERLFHYRWRERSMLRGMSETVKDALMEELIRHHPRAYRVHHADTRLLQMQLHIDGRDVMQSLAKSVSAAGLRAVTVYGAGEWGRFLKTELVRLGIQVQRFVDGNARLQGTHIETIPVTSIEEAVASGDRAFVVGSRAFAAAIADTIHAHCQAAGVEPTVFSGS